MDRYSPAPGTATCPYCDQVVAGVDVPPACQVALLTFRCPGCDREWDEVRKRDGVGRFYERDGAATRETPGSRSPPTRSTATAPRARPAAPWLPWR